ncbi:hypothetical protein C1646_762221 [Rhizophagus diaphanus]|nr:hypothetical protein C1646_762221 [Rhizophagus diaphanus] [Rhizophagus sp. MUCL 43196]
MSTLINTKVGALEKKLDERMDMLEEKISETDTKVTKMCERMDKLEVTVCQDSSTLKTVKSNDCDMRRVLEDNISYAENFLKTSNHTAEYKNITKELQKSFLRRWTVKNN